VNIQEAPMSRSVCMIEATGDVVKEGIGNAFSIKSKG